jgi:hypothetical protein
MTAARSLGLATLIGATTAFAGAARGQAPNIQNFNGQQVQVVERPITVPVQQMTSQQQTTYRQQVTTQTIQHQQLYTVPVTQYQLVSRLHGRWNPFITPYWTHHYEPVTTWQQQTATVQIPVNTMAWVPETRTVQTPTTTYQTVKQYVLTPVMGTPNGGSQQMLANNAVSTPTATLTPTTGAATATAAAAPTYAATTPTYATPRVAAAPAPAAAPVVAPVSAPAPAPNYGGRQLPSDPPRYSTATPNRY